MNSIVANISSRPPQRLGFSIWHLIFTLFFLALMSPLTVFAQSAPSELYVYEGLNATDENGAEFRWKDNSNDEDGFILERSSDGIHFTVRQTYPANSVKGADGVDVGGKFWFRVRATKGTGFSASSNILSFTNVWGPIYFKAYTTNPQQVTLEWFDRSFKEQGYFIERSNDGGLTYTKITQRLTNEFQTIPGAHSSPDKTKIFVDDNAGVGLSSGVNYRYRIAAYNGIASSPYASPGYLSVAPGMAPLTPEVSAALTQISSNGLTPTSIRLSLTDLSNNEKRTEVERSTDRVQWIPVGGISSTAGEPIVFDSRGDLVPNTQYFYRTYATNDVGRSPYSSYASVTIPAIPPGGVTAWYVWKGATGPRSGESWQNAWRDVDEINWVAVKPGDTLYISGDTYGKPLNVFAGGTQGNPVLIRPGSAAPNPTGHSTRVVVQGVYFAPGKNWITLDGSINPLLNPTSALQISSNINFESSGSDRHGVFSSSPVGISLRFIEVNSPAEGGVILTGLPSDFLDIFACHIHHIPTVGVVFGYASVRPVFDAFKLQKSLIEYTGDDAIQSSGNATISGNVIRHNYPNSAGHADGIQSVGGNYFKIFDNQIYDRTKSSYIFTSGSARSGTSGHWHVYNNLFYYSNSVTVPATAGILFSGQNDYEPGFAFIPEVQFVDILIANNTFVNFGGNRVFTITKRPAQVGTMHVSNMTVANNIFLDTGGIALKGDPESGVVFDRPSVVVDNNLIAGSGDIFYNSSYLTPTAFNLLFGAVGNSPLIPTFVNRSASDFRLSSADNAAKDKGRNLSSYFTKDARGLPRPSSGPWDIGAYEFSPLSPAAPTGLRTSR